MVVRISHDDLVDFCPDNLFKYYDMPFDMKRSTLSTILMETEEMKCESEAKTQACTPQCSPNNGDIDPDSLEN